MERILLFLILIFTFSKVQTEPNIPNAASSLWGTIRDTVNKAELNEKPKNIQNSLDLNSSDKFTPTTSSVSSLSTRSNVRKIMEKTYKYEKSRKYYSIMLQLCSQEYTNMAMRYQFIWSMNDEESNYLQNVKNIYKLKPKSDLVTLPTSTNLNTGEQTTEQKVTETSSPKKSPKDATEVPEYQQVLNMEDNVPSLDINRKIGVQDVNSSGKMRNIVNLDKKTNAKGFENSGQLTNIQPHTLREGVQKDEKQNGESYMHGELPLFLPNDQTGNLKMSLKSENKQNNLFPSKINATVNIDLNDTQNKVDNNLSTKKGIMNEDNYVDDKRKEPTNSMNEKVTSRKQPANNQTGKQNKCKGIQDTNTQEQIGTNNSISNNNKQKVESSSKSTTNGKEGEEDRHTDSNNNWKNPIQGPGMTIDPMMTTEGYLARLIFEKFAQSSTNEGDNTVEETTTMPNDKETPTEATKTLEIPDNYQSVGQHGSSLKDIESTAPITYDIMNSTSSRNNEADNNISNEDTNGASILPKNNSGETSGPSEKEPIQSDPGEWQDLVSQETTQCDINVNPDDTKATIQPEEKDINVDNNTKENNRDGVINKQNTTPSIGEDINNPSEQSREENSYEPLTKKPEYDKEDDNKTSLTTDRGKRIMSEDKQNEDMQDSAQNDNKNPNNLRSDAVNKIEIDESNVGENLNVSSTLNKDSALTSFKSTISYNSSEGQKLHNTIDLNKENEGKLLSNTNAEKLLSENELSENSLDKTKDYADLGETTNITNSNNSYNQQTPQIEEQEADTPSDLNKENIDEQNTEMNPSIDSTETTNSENVEETLLTPLPEGQELSGNTIERNNENVDHDVTDATNIYNKQTPQVEIQESENSSDKNKENLNEQINEMKPASDSNDTENLEYVGGNQHNRYNADSDEKANPENEQNKEIIPSSDSKDSENRENNGDNQQDRRNTDSAETANPENEQKKVIIPSSDSKDSENRENNGDNQQDRRNTDSAETANHENEQNKITPSNDSKDPENGENVRDNQQDTDSSETANPENIEGNQQTSLSENQVPGNDTETSNNNAGHQYVQMNPIGDVTDTPSCETTKEQTKSLDPNILAHTRISNGATLTTENILNVDSEVTTTTPEVKENDVRLEKLNPDSVHENSNKQNVDLTSTSSKINYEPVQNSSETGVIDIKPEILKKVDSLDETTSKQNFHLTSSTTAINVEPIQCSTEKPTTRENKDTNHITEGLMNTDRGNKKNMIISGSKENSIQNEDQGATIIKNTPYQKPKGNEGQEETKVSEKVVEPVEIRQQSKNARAENAPELPNNNNASVQDKDLQKFNIANIPISEKLTDKAHSDKVKDQDTPVINNSDKEPITSPDTSKNNNYWYNLMKTGSKIYESKPIADSLQFQGELKVFTQSSSTSTTTKPTIPTTITTIASKIDSMPKNSNAEQEKTGSNYALPSFSRWRWL